MNDFKSFNYIVDLKLSYFGNNSEVFQKIFPGIADFSMRSRLFSDYSDCATSCKALMEDITKLCNDEKTGSKFKIGSEINPAYGGDTAMSFDWDTMEVARIWIYDEDQEREKKISAISKARIFTSAENPNPLVLLT